MHRRKFLMLGGAVAAAPLGLAQSGAAPSAEGRPLIAGFSNRVETAPIGRYGLEQAR